MNFPTLSINPNIPFESFSERKTLKSPAEDGVVITRSLWTKTKKSWHIEYRFLPLTDYNTLLSFFENNAKGGAINFNWTHPITSTVYEVRFLNDKLSSSHETSTIVSCNFDLEEV